MTVYDLYASHQFDNGKLLAFLELEMLYNINYKTSFHSLFVVLSKVTSKLDQLKVVAKLI